MAAAMIGISALRSLHPLPPTFSVSATAPPLATLRLPLPLQQPRSCTSPRCRCRRHSLAHSTPRGATAASSVPSGAAGSAAFMASAPDNAALRHRLIAPKATAGTGDGGASGGLLPSILGIAQLAVSLGLVLATDKYLKQAFVAASIKFPSALFGMFCIFSVLVVLDLAAPALAKGFMDFFEPATLFIQRWLPLFYVPSLVVLPLAVRDVPAAAGLKICLITCTSTLHPCALFNSFDSAVNCDQRIRKVYIYVPLSFLYVVAGWLASLTVAGYTALTVRKIVKTELIAAEPMGKPSPFATWEFWAWGAVFVASFATAIVNPTALGTTARTCLPFMLASTVLGYMVGSGLPSGIKTVLHPIISCALSANFSAVAYGYLSGSGMDAALGDYLTKVPSNPGAGDVLMGFLGSVILSFAFSMFKQRKLVKRHAAEIFTSIAVASTFSLYSTAILGRLIGLEPTLTISILPRCITVALALSIVSFFEGANTSVTAAVVVLTGLIGANFVQAAMDKLGLNDPIARGIGTASSAHGLGTAALSAKEPEALPFCAIAYALTGIFGSLICSSSAVRQSLVFIAG
ncbi:plastidal glycolate/glycerate translocator 1, chloroplastic isoform X1 [Lolium perenne]|uniref:plastidal glycolate/glycerate translocator 1, chloroplastic isoform X1 n=1 Tax=Lolium perenne TaxID=4522 RepID=UPI0021F59621|nr:plastidal glycolate/glycerate translocator 1, chloroplastic-like isoform X1 [Lolium perenne]